MRRLSPEELAAAEKALIGELGDALRLVLFDLAMRRDPRASDEVWRALEELGWVRSRSLTSLGRLVADPLREYSFWLARERRLPSERQVPMLRRGRFRGKRVAELGSGGGCNLLSLSGIPASLVGVEPMPLYVQMTPLLARMAKLPTPRVIEGAAEAIPLRDASQDVLLCYSSHQYMDVDRALEEMARVLAPGGELVMVGNSLFPFALESAIRFLRTRSVGNLKYDAVAILNTLGYEAIGRRIVGGGESSTTARPIYPSRWHMVRALDGAGFAWNAHGSRVVDTGESVLVAVRR